MSRYRKGYEALGEALRKRAATELDHETEERAEPAGASIEATGMSFYGAVPVPVDCDLDYLRNLASGYLASRAREKRLEALVRQHAKCQRCKGTGQVQVRTDVDECEMRQCPDCAGTGLVEAARKELER